MTVHEVTFQRNRITGLHRAMCSCGWFTTGSQTECQVRASVHDTEWVDYDPTPAQANTDEAA